MNTTGSLKEKRESRLSGVSCLEMQSSNTTATLLFSRFGRIISKMHPLGLITHLEPVLLRDCMYADSGSRLVLAKESKRLTISRGGRRSVSSSHCY